MSCQSQNSCPATSLFKLLLFAGFAALLYANHKEILRYIKISTM
jgi:hypothetical protein